MSGKKHIDDGYKPFAVVEASINRLEVQGLLKLTSEKDQIVESITRDLIEAGVLREFINVERPYPTNVHNTLEEYITEGGRVIFVRKIELDADQGSLTFDLQFDPESDRIDKTLIFRDVQNFKETLHDEEEPDIHDVDSIIGLDQYSTKYILTTEIREIIFTSIATPEILS